MQGPVPRFVANTPVTVKIISVDPATACRRSHTRAESEFWQVLDEPMDIPT